MAQKNRRIQKKEEYSLNKIRQLLKAPDGPTSSFSQPKSPSITSTINSSDPTNDASNKQNKNSFKTKLKPHRPVISSANILASRVNLIKTKNINVHKNVQAHQKWFKGKEESKPQINIEKTEDQESQGSHVYFIECMSKTHPLIKEIRLHLQNSLLVFRQFFKTCQTIKYKNPVKLTPEVQGRKTIVFDMDQTLIHTNQKMINNYDMKVPFRLFKGKIGYGYVSVRPYAKQILKKLHEFFDIIIFTASSKAYADPILNHLDPDNLIQHRLYRDHCTLVRNQIFVKDLRILGRKLENVVLVDNAPYSYLMQLSNGIPILPYYRGQDDQLVKLEPYLMQLKDVQDVRIVNSQYFCLYEYMKYDTGEKVISKVYSKWIK